jgi:hypothetical protein
VCEYCESSSEVERFMVAFHLRLMW